MESKTDALVLLELIDDLAEKQPPNSSHVAYQHLQAYNTEIGSNFDIMRIVIESCNRLNNYIDILPRLKDKNKLSFRAAVQSFREAFALGNMGTRWDIFLTNIAQPVHVQALNFFDHLISAQDFWQRRAIEPDEANKLIDDLENFVKKSAFPKYGKDIILNDLIKMRFILQNIEKFGEQDYWEKFERVTGLFGSLYSNLREEEKPEAQNILQRMIYRVNQTIETGSNLTTIAQAAWPLLT